MSQWHQIMIPINVPPVLLAPSFLGMPRLLFFLYAPCALTEAYRWPWTTALLNCGCKVRPASLDSVNDAIKDGLWTERNRIAIALRTDAVEETFMGGFCGLKLDLNGRCSNLVLGWLSHAAQTYRYAISKVASWSSDGMCSLHYSYC